MRLSETASTSVGAILRTKPLYCVKKYATSIEFVKTCTTPLYDFDKQAAVVETADGFIRFGEVFTTAKEAWMKAADFMHCLSVKTSGDGGPLKDWCEIHFIYQDLMASKMAKKKVNHLLNKESIEKIEATVSRLKDSDDFSIVDAGIADNTDYEVSVIH